MEEKRTVFFRGEMVYTQDALVEITRQQQRQNKLKLFIYGASCVLLIGEILRLLSYGEPFSFPYQMIVLYILVYFLAQWLFGRNNNITYNRMLSQNDGIPLHHCLEFNEQKIAICNPHSGNHHAMYYEQIHSVAQTQRFFVLGMVHNQFIALDKATLSGTPEEFLNFLFNACKNMKPKKLRSSLLGNILPVVVLVLLGISLVLHFIFQFYMF